MTSCTRLSNLLRFVLSVVKMLMGFDGYFRRKFLTTRDALQLGCRDAVFDAMNYFPMGTVAALAGQQFGFQVCDDSKRLSSPVSADSVSTTAESS